MKYLFVLSLLFAGVSLSAQNYFPGYIITKDGGLQRGLIAKSEANADDVTQYHQIQFRAKVTAPSQTYTAADLLGYLLGNEEYYSINLAGAASQQVFAKQVAGGDIELLKYRESQSASEKFIFKKKYESQYYLYAPEDKTLQKGNEVLFSAAGLEKKKDIQRVDQQFKLHFTRYFEECAVLARKIELGSYDDGNLETMVRIYNDCL